MDYENHCFKTVSDASFPDRKILTIPFKMSDGSVRSVLGYLSEKNLVSQSFSGSFSLTHAGFVFLSDQRQSFCRGVLSTLITEGVLYLLTKLVSILSVHLNL